MDLNSLDTASRPLRPAALRRADTSPVSRPQRAAKAVAAPDKPVAAAAPDGHEHPLATAHF